MSRDLDYDKQHPVNVSLRTQALEMALRTRTESSAEMIKRAALFFAFMQQGTTPD